MKHFIRLFYLLLSLPTVLYAQNCVTAEINLEPVYCYANEGYQSRACISISGGTAPYQVSANNTNLLINDLQAGTSVCEIFNTDFIFFGEPSPIPLQFVITDADQCVTNATYLLEFKLFGATHYVEHATCHEDNGKVFFQTWGGSGSYNVREGNTDYGDFMAGIVQSIGGLAPGTHTFTLTDLIYPDCVIQNQTVTIYPIGDFEVNSIPSPATSCDGLGEVCFDIIGTNPPYQIQNAFGQILGLTDMNGSACIEANASSKWQAFLITDTDGCQVQHEELVTADNIMSATVTNTTPATVCNGMGQACLHISGGTQPYYHIYFIDDMGIIEEVSADFCVDLPAGFNTLDISDGLGCGTSVDILIPSPADDLMLTGLQVSDVTNCDTPNGSFCFAITGGLAPYSVFLGGNLWMNDMAEAENRCFVSLESGQYFLTIEDANACQMSTTISISGNCVPFVISPPCPLPPTTTFFENICGTDTINLNSIANAAPETVWRDQYHNIVANPDSVVLQNNSCETQTYTFSDRQITADGCELVWYYIQVTVYPQISGTIQLGFCTATFVPTCPNYNISWTTSTGANGTGNVFESIIGNPVETVTFLVSNQDGTCSVVPFEMPFTCDEPCATLPGYPVEHMCGGGVYIDLTTWLATEWFENPNQPIAQPDSVWIPETTGCEPQTYTFYATIESENCPSVTAPALEIVVYPLPTASAIETDCILYLVPDCPNWAEWGWEATWADDLGNSGMGMNYQNANGEPSTVNFTIGSTDPTLSSCTQIISADYNCGIDCSLVDPYIPAPFIIKTCSGEPFALPAIGEQGETLIWYADSQLSSLIENPSQMNSENLSCEVVHTQYYALYAENVPCAGTVLYTCTVSNYPLIMVTASADECGASVIAQCPGYVITWTDDFGNSGTGGVYSEGLPNQIANVTFTIIQSDAAIAELTCSTVTVNAAVTCELFPCDPIAPIFIDTEVCHNDVVNLETLTSMGGMAWYNDDTGEEIADPNNIIVTNNNCDPQIYAFSSPYTEICTGATWYHRVYLTVYPNINAQVLSAVCGASISQQCNHFAATWIASNGTSGTGFSYSSTVGESGTVTFTVTNTLDFIGCSSAQITAPYSCPVGGCLANAGTVTGDLVMCNDPLFADFNIAYFQTSGTSPANYAYAFVAVLNGNIIKVSTPNLTTNAPHDGMIGFSSVPEGQYCVYGIAYDPANPPTGIVEGASFSAITGGCSQVSSTCAMIDVLNCTTLNYTTTTDGTVIDEEIEEPITPPAEVSNVQANPQNGSVIVDPNGNVVYIPNPGFIGTDEFAIFYTGIDGELHGLMVTVNVQAGGLCQIEPQTVCTEPLTPIELCLHCPESQVTIFNIHQPLFNCGIDLNLNCITYTPLPGMEIYGPDSLVITYCSTTDSTDCLTTYFIINVGDCAAPNNPPLAINDTLYSDGNAITINALLNDTDPDNDSLQITVFGQPLNGIVVLNNGIFQYTPDTGFTGSDQFTYQICDPEGACDYGVVVIHVTQDEPCESNTNICAQPITPMILCPEFCNLPANEPYQILEAETTFNCALQEYGDDCLRYTALPLFAGQETITVIACTSLGVCDTAYITVQVAQCDAEGGITPPNQGGKVKHYFGNNGTVPLALHNLMPVPAQDNLFLYFDAPQTQMLKVDIVDVIGRVVQSQIVEARQGSNLLQVQVDDLSRGMYVLRLSNEKEMSTGKFVKQ